MPVRNACSFLRSCAHRPRPHTVSRSHVATPIAQMDEFSMVYYNNLLSIPPILVLMWFFGEYEGLMAQTALRNPSFQMVAMVGGVLGFAIRCVWRVSRGPRKLQATCLRGERALGGNGGGLWVESRMHVPLTVPTFGPCACVPQLQQPVVPVPDHRHHLLAHRLAEQDPHRHCGHAGVRGAHQPQEPVLHCDWAGGGRYVHTIQKQEVGRAACI